MHNILAEIEHHPVIISILIAILSAVLTAIWWAIKALAAKRISGAKAKEEFIAFVKEFVLFLDEFGDRLFNTGTYDEFVSRIKYYKEVFRKALSGMDNNSLLQNEIEGIYDSVQNFLSQGLYIDGGMSFAKQCEHINSCKSHADNILKLLTSN